MKGNTPTKGVTPDFTGVQGELLTVAPPDLIFGERKLRTSPYDPQILKLKEAPAGACLKFTDAKARASLMVRSRKLEIPLLFAEQDGVPYARLGEAPKVGGFLSAVSDDTNRSHVLKALAIGKDTTELIVPWVRLNGGKAITPSVVDGILSALLRSGSVRLKDNKRGDTTERYEKAA